MEQKVHQPGDLRRMTGSQIVSAMHKPAFETRNTSIYRVTDARVIEI